MPIKIKEVESFLEFVNFYQRFIQNFSHTAKPLNDSNGYLRTCYWRSVISRIEREIETNSLPT